MIDLRLGDCLEVLKEIPDNSVDSIVTDPPYGLSFMGKKWDYDVPSEDVWRECLRVLKPGGHLLSFAGSRTYHRMVVRIEDAGFEIRDQIMYLYGSGFPKSLNVFKQFQKECTCGFLVKYEHNYKGLEHSSEDTEHDLRFMRDPDLSAAKSDTEAGGEVLLSRLQEQGSSVADASCGSVQFPEGRSEYRVEGRRNVPEREGELHRPALREVSAGIHSNGAKGRLHNGASAGNGSTHGAAPNANGSGASRRSQSEEQFDREPCAFCKQFRTQALRAFGSGSGLKPAHEPIVLARKPLCGTIAQNVLEHGTGGLNIDGCRVATDWAKDRGETWLRSGNDAKPLDRLAQVPNHQNGSSCADRVSSLGRFPANIIHDGSDEVVELFPQTTSGSIKAGRPNGTSFSIGGELGKRIAAYDTTGDSGSAARFFKQVKCDNDLWQDQSRQQSSANIAEHHSFQSVQDVVSALDLVVKREVPGGRLSSDTTIHFTTVTANKCVIIYEAVTQLIQSLDKRFWHELPPESITRSNSLARVAVTRKQTDTTTITVSLSKSGGYVEVVTFSIMQPSTEHGAKDCLHGHKFRYCAKASKRDRDEGLDGFEKRRGGSETFDPANRDGVGEDRMPKVRNHHPTVKPTDLMKYLCRLITPPNGIVLDPFMGSGSTGKGAVLEGFRFIGIEREPEYFEIAKARIESAKQ